MFQPSILFVANLECMLKNFIEKKISLLKIEVNAFQVVNLTYI